MVHAKSIVESRKPGTLRDEAKESQNPMTKSRNIVKYAVRRLIHFYQRYNMTNREKYKKQIDKVISTHIEERRTKPIDEIICTYIAMVHGRIKRCSICTPCAGCDFHKMNTDGIDCKEFTRKWLYEEPKK